MLVPTRFTLADAELAGALALAQITPEPTSTLPAPAVLKQAKRALQAAGATDESGAIVPALDAALRVAAAPSREVSIRVVRAGAPAAKETLLLRSAGRPEVVARSFDGTTHGIVVTPDHNQAAVLVDELLSLTDLIAGDGTELLELDVPALVALVALADTATTETYRSRLERRPSSREVLATLAGVTAMFDEGVGRDDTRWTVTAMRAMAPVDLMPEREHLGDGLATLTRLGLVAGSGESARCTERGRFVATVLGQLIVAASIGVTVIDGGQRVPVGPVTVLRTATTIWLGSWSQPPGGAPQVTLAEVTADGALAVVCDLLEDTAPPASVTSAPPATAAEPPAPAAAWAPTHIVPAGGSDAWVEPDPSVPAVAHLEPGLDVLVDERRGAWAHIVCSNGWSAWLDGSRLEEITA